MQHSNNYVPLVSVCIPLYNGEKYLVEALESVEEQTYPNCEVIISDDNSTDNTIQVALLFQKRCKFPVKIVYNEIQNRGIGNNWNNCITHAVGDYIKFLFQDDLLHKDCIEKMMAKVELYPNVGFVYCKRDFIYPPDDLYYIDWINEFGELQKSWFSDIDMDGVIKGSILLKDRNLLNHPQNKFGEPIATLIKKEIFTQIGLFNTQLKQTLDIEFWNRLLVVTDTIFIDERLVTFRLHIEQTSSVNHINKLNEINFFYNSMYLNLLFNLHYSNIWFLALKFNPLLISFNENFIYLKKRLKYSYLKKWLRTKYGRY